MEHSPEVSYLIGKAIRRGSATYAEVRDATAPYGATYADTVLTEMDAAGVRLLEEHEIPITRETNVLMNQLTLVELVSLALRLPPVTKIARRLYRNSLGVPSHELDLRRLDYLDGDYQWYYLSPVFNSLQRSLRRLFDSEQIPFSKDWRESDRVEDRRYLANLAAHPMVNRTVSPQIRQHYRRLPAVRLLEDWIHATGKSSPVMTDIMRTAITHSGPIVLRSVLLSDQPSEAQHALRRRTDVCFQCAPERRCIPLRGVDDPYPVLAAYRASDLRTLLARRYPLLSMADSINRDYLLAKFYVPYSMVVLAKRFMVEIGYLDRSATVLPKNAGRYCPCDDAWPLSNQL